MNDWAILDTLLRQHGEQFRDLYLRWQQLEVKANSAITCVGILLASNAVCLQLGIAHGTLGKLSVSLACIAVLVTVVLAIFAQRVKGLKAPLSSKVTHDVVFTWYQLPESDRLLSRLAGELMTPWDGAIQELETELEKKGDLVRRAQVALGAAAVLTVLTLLFAILKELGGK